MLWWSNFTSILNKLFTDVNLRFLEHALDKGREETTFEHKVLCHEYVYIKNIQMNLYKHKQILFNDKRRQNPRYILVDH